MRRLILRDQELGKMFSAPSHAVSREGGGGDDLGHQGSVAAVRD